MIACCACMDWSPDYPANIFVEDISTLMLFVLPAAICVVLWKVFVTNRITPRGNVLSLGLDESSATHAELYGQNIPWRTLFLQVLVGVGTFKLGLVAYETYCFIQEWFANLNMRIY